MHTCIHESIKRREASLIISLHIGHPPRPKQCVAGRTYPSLRRSLVASFPLSSSFPCIFYSYKDKSEVVVLLSKCGILHQSFSRNFSPTPSQSSHMTRVCPNVECPIYFRSLIKTIFSKSVMIAHGSSCNCPPSSLTFNASLWLCTTFCARSIHASNLE